MLPGKLSADTNSPVDCSCLRRAGPLARCGLQGTAAACSAPGSSPVGASTSTNPGTPSAPHRYTRPAPGSAGIDAPSLEDYRYLWSAE